MTENQEELEKRLLKLVDLNRKGNIDFIVVSGMTTDRKLFSVAGSSLENQQLPTEIMEIPES